MKRVAMQWVVSGMLMGACSQAPVAGGTAGTGSTAVNANTSTSGTSAGTKSSPTAGATTSGSMATAGATSPAPTAGAKSSPTTSAGSSAATAGASGMLAAGHSAAGSGSNAGSGATTMGTLPPVTDVSMKGPYEVTVDQKGGANSWVFRPTDLGKDGVKHPIFVFGCGATSTPSQYVDHWTLVASHGFVVVSPNNSMVDAPAMKAALDWILAQNDMQGSPYYQKLDTKKVAMGGHSLGSIATFDQEAMETRLTTTIHIAGGSFDGMGSSKVKTPTAYMCGEMSADIASPQCKTDFENVKDQPTYFVQLAGVDHVGAARQALPGIVSWLRWHLAGEDRKKMFVGAGCDFCKDKWANAQTKNF